MMPLVLILKNLKKVPWSFRRTKTVKEIVLEKKQLWEKEKLMQKIEAKKELLNFAEEKKQERHAERCSIMKEIMKIEWDEFGIYFRSQILV